MRIKEYTKATSLASTDAFVVETSSGTKYVEKQSMGFVATSGGTMTGELKLQYKDATLRLVNEFETNFRLHVYGSEKGKGSFGIYNVTTSKHPLYINEETGYIFDQDAKRIMAWDKIYPVGAVYLSYVSTSPGNLFGGSWEQITNRVLRAATNVTAGGSDTHTLTVAEMPSHTHQGDLRASSSTGSGSGGQLIRIASTDHTFQTFATGGGEAHNNLPAYQNLYAWRRTA